MYEEGRGETDYEEGEGWTQEKSNTSEGVRVKVRVGRPMLLAGSEEPWKEDCDSSEDEPDQGQEGLLTCTDVEPGEGEMAKLEHLVKRTHAAWSLQIK